MTSTAIATVVKQEPNLKMQPQIQEFSIGVPKNSKKKHNVMRYNGVLKVDFKEWKQVKMERENNMKDYRGVEEEMPKFGAGSEFGREAREEARRKKFGIISKKYKVEDQPWILKANGKTGKKFKGTREGGISENAAYYVFTHAADGKIEAFPLHEWYNFQPIQRYKALSAEEAEEEFSKRDRAMNYFNLMLRKRLRKDEDGDDEGVLDGEKKGKKSSKKQIDLKISEMDEWIDSDDDDDDDSDKNDKNNSDDDDAKKKKKKADLKKKLKKKKASDDEAFEESDDGDEEGRECDYISDSSASESELEMQKEIKSVAEEDALRKLLASDEEDEDEEQKDKKEENGKNEDEKKNDEKVNDKADKTGDKKNGNKKNKKKEDGNDSSSSHESGYEQNKVKGDKKLTKSEINVSVSPAQVNTGPSNSLKRMNGSLDVPPAKKLKCESNYLPSCSYISGSSESGITEDAVRRYLTRKPMTTTELLQKFKSKKTGLSSEQIVTIMTKILKHINPTSQKIKGKMYFSIKTPQTQQTN